MSLKSLIEIHPNCQIILWTPNLFELNGSLSSVKIKKHLKDHLTIKEADKKLFSDAEADYMYSQYMLLLHIENQSSLAYASDIIRFIILQVYGGVWFDLDVLFLRDFNTIKINNYVSQWGTDTCGNAAIMRLPKHHNLLKNIYKSYEQPCYPTTTFVLENDLNITIMPSTFFDILWRPQEQIPKELQFKTFDDFFIQEKLNLPKQIYAYHWHNHWHKAAPTFFNNVI